MEQTQNQPLYWDKHRIPVNLTLILSLGIAVWGLYNFINGDTPVIFFLGIGVAVYTWVTSPRIYMIYADSLYIVYGKPRVKVIHFSNIDVVEMGSLATPDRLRVRPIKGRRQILLARDPEAFFDQLEAALNAFRAAHPEYGITLESSRDMAAGIIDVEPVAVIPTDDPAHVPESSDPESIAEYYGESATLEEGAGETPAPAGSADTDRYHRCYPGAGGQRFHGRPAARHGAPAPLLTDALSPAHLAQGEGGAEGRVNAAVTPPGYRPGVPSRRCRRCGSTYCRPGGPWA